MQPLLYQPRTAQKQRHLKTWGKGSSLIIRCLLNDEVFLWFGLRSVKGKVSLEGEFYTSIKGGKSKNLLILDDG